MGTDQKKKIKKNPALIQKKVVVDCGALSVVNKDEVHNPSQVKNLGAMEKFHLEVTNPNHNWNFLMKLVNLFWNGPAH